MTFIEMLRESVETSFPDHQITWMASAACMIGRTPFSVLDAEIVDSKPESEQRQLLAHLIEAAKGAVEATDALH